MLAISRHDKLFRPAPRYLPLPPPPSALAHNARGALSPRGYEGCCSETSRSRDGFIRGKCASLPREYRENRIVRRPPPLAPLAALAASGKPTRSSQPAI